MTPAPAFRCPECGTTKANAIALATHRALKHQVRGQSSTERNRRMRERRKGKAA